MPPSQTANTPRSSVPFTFTSGNMEFGTNVVKGIVEARHPSNVNAPITASSTLLIRASDNSKDNTASLPSIIAGVLGGVTAVISIDGPIASAIGGNGGPGNTGPLNGPLGSILSGEPTHEPVTSAFSSVLGSAPLPTNTTQSANNGNTVIRDPATGVNDPAAAPSSANVQVVTLTRIDTIFSQSTIVSGGSTIITSVPIGTVTASSISPVHNNVSRGANVPAMAGGAVGAVMAIVLLVAAFIFLRRKPALPEGQPHPWFLYGKYPRPSIERLDAEAAIAPLSTERYSNPPSITSSAPPTYESATPLDNEVLLSSQSPPAVVHFPDSQPSTPCKS